MIGRFNRLCVTVADTTKRNIIKEAALLQEKRVVEMIAKNPFVEYAGMYARLKWKWLIKALV